MEYLLGMMIGNGMRQISGILSTRVQAGDLSRAWEGRPEAGIAPTAIIETDGRKFTITYRGVKHAFTIVAQQLGHLALGPSVEIKVSWSE